MLQSFGWSRNLLDTYPVKVLNQADSEANQVSYGLLAGLLAGLFVWLNRAEDASTADPTTPGGLQAGTREAA